MSWYARSGPRRKEIAKFHSYSKFGTENSDGGQYRDWHFRFVAHQTGSGVRRTRYAVAISDPQRQQAAYLRDCANIQQATEAAKQWIDDKVRHSILTRIPDEVGTIPKLPKITAPASLYQANAGQAIRPEN